MEFDDDGSELTSKTRRKKEMHALQAVGTRLVEFPESRLAQLPLSEKLRTAIREYKRLPNSHEARRRQIQYIGRLMRDHELDQIEQQIDQALAPPRETARQKKLIQSSCDQVLMGGDPAITRLIEQYNDLDRQTLRRFYLDYQKAERLAAEQESEILRKKLANYLKDRLL
ncbi:MAG: ribosome biogenesis factor YjgA [Gammaproteobacteria bacterium]